MLTALARLAGPRSAALAPPAARAAPARARCARSAEVSRGRAASTRVRTRTTRSRSESPRPSARISAGRSAESDSRTSPSASRTMRSCSRWCAVGIALARARLPRAADVRTPRRCPCAPSPRAGGGSSATAPCSAAPPAPRPPRGAADTSRASSCERLDGERVELLEPGDRDAARRLAQLVAADVVVELPGAEHEPLDGLVVGRRGRRAPGGTSPLASSSSVDDACFSRRRPFGDITTSGRATTSSAWRRRRWKNCAAVVQLTTRMFSCAPSWRNRSSRALECSGPVALVPVRQQQRQARGLVPLRAAGDDELVDHDLGAVHEVAELRLPEDERVGRRDRVAVLEAERRVLGERRVVDLEGRVRARQVLHRRDGLARARIVEDEVAVGERPPLRVLAGEPDRDPVLEQRGERERLGLPPVDPALSSVSRRRSSWRASFGLTVKPSGTTSSCSLSVAEPVGRDRRLDRVAGRRRPPAAARAAAREARRTRPAAGRARRAASRRPRRRSAARPPGADRRPRRRAASA